MFEKLVSITFRMVPIFFFSMTHLWRVGEIRDPVEHGAHVIGASGLVLHDVVPVKKRGQLVS